MYEVNRVAIIGCGLIGGSMGLALKKRNLAEKVIGVGREMHRLSKAIELAAVDEITTDLKIGTKTADLVILATPVSAILEIAPRLVPYLKPGCIVSDVGSTKSEIVHTLTPALGMDLHFVGSHPMAGSEVSGVEASRADLFEGATCVLTPIEGTNKAALSVVRSIWEAFGSRVIEMDPAEHDLIVGMTSHLPHIVASCLVDLASEEENKTLPLLVAGGFRDMTRIAASSPDLWRDICLTNREIIVDLLAKFKDRLDQFRDLVDRKNGEELLGHFKKTKEWRDLI